ncbi:MAG: hypothetical protein K0U54_01745 [Bacteroidetes bacterium]|nr:hypothetical protein [Bacteroidota bacterium]
MKFNYSYRAFLITSLLVGNLVLLLVSVKLNKKQTNTEDVMPITYEEVLPEDEEIALSMDNVKINTNTAYNEAEKFIRELEDSRNTTMPLEEDSNPLEAAEAPDYSKQDATISDAQQQLNNIKKKLSQKPQKKKAEMGASVNRKTTISYSLTDRKQLSLPNPVYTCDSGGKIVINVEVNTLGKVTKTTFNKAASTTTNGCLIDSAIEYARTARFTTKAGRSSQIGTISYSFPGKF